MNTSLFDIYYISKTLKMRPLEVLDLYLWEKQIILYGLEFENNPKDKKSRNINILEMSDDELDKLKKKLMGEIRNGNS